MDKSNKSVKNDIEPVIKKETKNKDIRIDSSKDYIYFSNDNLIEGELDIDYMDININFIDSNNIASKLNNETAKMQKNLKYDEEIDDDSYNKLSEASYKKYSVYTYGDYLSLVVDYYTFDRENLVSYDKSDTFVFNLTNGKLLRKEEILSNFNKTEDDILKYIKDYLDGQTLLDNGDEISIQDSIDSNSDFKFFIDKIGRLSVSIIVKSEQKDYNDIIIID